MILIYRFKEELLLKNIALITNTEKDFDFNNTNALIEYLGNFDAQIFVDKSCYKKASKNVKAISYEELFINSDVIITLGGDGTILKCAHLAAAKNIPVLGINIGHLGYMTEIDMNEISSIEKLFNNEYNIEQRMLLDISVLRNEKVIFNALSLNDIVVSYGHFSRIINLKLLCNKKKIMDYRADGVIICTPTGSTAYSLAAGGPIIEPLLSAITVTPICAHSLTSKSIVFSDNSILDIVIPSQKADNIFLSVDGHNNISLNYDDYISVKKSSTKFSLIKLNNLSFYEILNKKFAKSN